MRHGIYRSSVEAEVRAPCPRGVRAPREPACGGARRRPARAASCMGPGGPAPPVVRKSLAPKNRLNSHYPPICVHPVHAPIRPCPRPHVRV